MKSNYIEHPWLKDYPVLPEHNHLIIGTHPPMPYSGCMAFYYGNMNEFWRLLESSFKEELFFDKHGKPDLSKIIKWLKIHRIGITDIVQFTIKGNAFNSDQKMDIVDAAFQLNQYLRVWLEKGNITTLFFTSFSEGKSAYSLFRKWYRLNYGVRLKKGKEIIESGNKEYITIKGKKIRTVMFYSPSPAARRGIPRSKPYQEWLKQHAAVNNSIDVFRINWYREYLKEIIISAK